MLVTKTKDTSILNRMELYELEIEFDAVDRMARQARPNSQEERDANNYLAQIGRAIDKKRKGR